MVLKFRIKVILCLVLFLAVHEVRSQVPATKLTLKDPLKAQNGYVVPNILDIAPGLDALLMVTAQVVNQQACYVTTPSGQHFNTSSPPDNRFESWGNGCGLRIKQVTAADTGRWKLNATRPGHSIAGYSAVYVLDAVTVPAEANLDLYDGQKNVEVDLTTVNSTHCTVAKPFQNSILVPGHCRVEIDSVSRALQGQWEIILGIPGQVKEVAIQKQVQVQSERLDVGYIQDTEHNKLHMFCNVLHTNKSLTFCRFQSVGSSIGYNLVDGISDGSHSYYGEGFAAKNCGMTIENPSAEDQKPWRCTVGYEETASTGAKNVGSMQALINVEAPSRKLTHAGRDLSGDIIDNQRTIFAVKDSLVTLDCQSEEPLSYCWFQHPNGSQFTPGVTVEDEDQVFWFSGESLALGDCGITFDKAVEDLDGLWTCHMGPSDKPGVETIDSIDVRVTGPLAAHRETIETDIGESATLYCHTAGRVIPLNYCRFLSPSNIGMNLVESITQENAILGKYFFTPGTSLQHGQCSLTIARVGAEDVGDWSCAASLLDSVVEAQDRMLLIDVPRKLSVAGITGVALCGIAAVTVILVVGYVSVRRKTSTRTDVPFENMTQTTSVRTSNGSTLSSVSESASVLTETREGILMDYLRR